MTTENHNTARDNILELGLLDWLKEHKIILYSNAVCIGLHFNLYELARRWKRRGDYHFAIKLLDETCRNGAVQPYILAHTLTGIS